MARKNIVHASFDGDNTLTTKADKEPRKSDITRLDEDKKNKQSIKGYKEKQMNVISLFTGAGGLDIGFKEAGFNIVFASDIMPQAEETFKFNFPSTTFVRKDVRLFSIDEILKLTDGKNIDVIIGGPPCQGFSNMGNKNSSDPRNYLFENYVRIVDAVQPKCFLFENVKGLFTMFEGRFFDKVVNAFLEIGYNISYSMIDSSKYGVPQKRERIIIFGTKINRPFKFPIADKEPFGNISAYGNVGEAINDLVNKDEQFPNHITLNHSDIVIKRYELIPEGGKLPKPEHLPMEIRRKNFGNTYTRLHREEVASTIVPGNNALPVHPTLNRSLTPREAARIQTFPDWFVFRGDRRSQCILVGNAVPPLLAAKLAKSVADFINGVEYDGILPEGCAHLGITFSRSRRNGVKKVGRATLKFADLFAGVGGFTQGLEAAGLECVLGADFDSYAVDAYRRNHTTHDCLQIDLSTEENQKLVADRLKKAKVDLIVGGPPCQGFSIFGKRRFVNTKNHDLSKDKRNDLVFAFANIVVKSKANWFIMENVPGILSAHNGSYVEEIRDFFKKHGYKTEPKVINAADYGVPQLRKRFILFGTRTDLLIPFPKPKYFEEPESWQLPYRTVGEVLTDLSNESTLGKFKNHDAPKHMKVVAERFSYIKEGHKLDVESLPQHLRNGTKTGKPISNYSHVFKRLHRGKPSGTIVPGHNAFPVHPTLNRTLTVREAARIQTFPDHYEFVGPIINQCLQVGNAFPPLVAQIFGERLRTVVNKDWSDENTTHYAKYSMLEQKESCQ
jgi:DNA (cytosine-5)-methyltransferase 1